VGCGAGEAETEAAETEAADAAQKEAEAEIPATPEFEAPVESTPDFVPEEAYFSDNTEEAGEEQLQMMEQLKQKLCYHLQLKKHN
jgi:hypothetical protein